MTRPEQKAHERKVVEYYLRKIRRKGDICDSETPSAPEDFIFCQRNKIVGIEVVDYYRPKDLGDKFMPMQVRDEQNKLIAAAHNYRTHPDNHNIKNLRVSMRFKSAVFPPEKCHRMFVESVYSTIRSYKIPTDGLPIKIKLDNEQNHVLSRQLSKLEVATSDVYLDWECQDTVHTSNMDDVVLIKIISKKCNKRFNEQLDEIHLIISGYGPYEFQYVGDTSENNVRNWQELNSLIVSSPFDVVAIINPPESVVWRKTTRKWKKL